MSFILPVGDPVPDGYYATDWFTLADDTAWQFIDTLDQFPPQKVGAAHRNLQWSTKVSGVDPSAVLAATTSATLDSDEWGLAQWSYAPDALLDEVLVGLKLPASPKVDVSSYYGSVYLAGGFPPGAEGIQVESEWLVPTGPCRLVINMSSGTHVLSKEFYTLNFYLGIWSSGPQWAASGGDPNLSHPAVETVAAAASRTFLGAVVGPTDNFTPGNRIKRIPLPDFSTFQPWNDGTTDVGLPIKALIRAAVDGVLPPFGVSTNAVFLVTAIGGAGCEMICRFPRYRWFYPIVYQRSYPRDDGKGDSVQRSYPPPVDSARSYPYIP